MEKLSMVMATMMLGLLLAACGSVTRTDTLPTQEPQAESALVVETATATPMQPDSNAVPAATVPATPIQASPTAMPAQPTAMPPVSPAATPVPPTATPTPVLRDLSATQHKQLDRQLEDLLEAPEVLATCARAVGETVPEPFSEGEAAWYGEATVRYAECAAEQVTGVDFTGGN